MNKKELTSKIKDYAYSLGFDECTICKAESVDDSNQTFFEEWIGNNFHGEMGYMANNIEKRLAPTLLVDGAESIIMLALNYYPTIKQNETYPQFAYYAYGKDYHEIVKEKLKKLYDYCQSLSDTIEGRYFCDTAPLLERYWAAKSGMGWIGKNSLLIIPKKGTYFFLSSLILNIELEYDDASKQKMPVCANCTKCIDACPTKAIVSPRIIDSNKCLSYQTIENKKEIGASIIPNISNRFYGCDICQQVCPWNKFSVAHSTKEFEPTNEFLALDYNQLKNMEVETYQRIFKGSAVKRAKLSGLKRNIDAWRKSKEQN